MAAHLEGLNGLTGGTGIDYLVLRNVGTHDCSLGGTPAFAAFDRHGRPVHLVPTDLDGDFAHPLRRIALLARSAHLAWREAAVPISVSGLTDQGDICQTADIDFGSVQVRVPGSGTVSARVPTGGDGGPLGTCEGRIRTGGFIALDG